MIENLSKEYRSSLKDFLAGGGETALESAYLLGRQALDQGIGVLDISAIHHQVLVTLLGRLDAATQTRIVKQAGKFLAECLSPFEMAQRGFRESITALKHLNEVLEDQVEERTQALRASEERYRTVIEISPDAITMTDLEGKVLVCNQQSAQLHGCSSSDELTGTNLESSVTPEDLPYVREMAQNVLFKGMIGSSEYTMIGKDGRRTPVEARVAMLRDSEGQAIGFVGISRDISERKRAQLKLESQERKQAALAELGLRSLSKIEINTLMHETVRLVSQTLNVEYCELLELLPEKNSLILREGVGWKEDAIGKTIVMAGEGSQAGYTLLTAQPVIVENLPEEIRFIPPAFLTEHNIIAGMTVIIYGKDQPYGILGAHVSQPRQFSLEEANFLQSIANILAMAIDNRRLLETETKARQRAEEDTERTIKSLAMVSHELRTPLTSIKGFASTLLAEDVVWNAEQQRDFIQTISDEANKLNSFIEQLLEISKMGAGVFKFSITRQPVEDLIATVIAPLQTLTERHNFVVDIPETLPDILADTQRVGQVLTNLVENATKYSPAGTAIRLSAQSRESFIEFSVEDEGPGIPLDDREKVFQAFYRVGDKTTLKAKGAGLGLTICQGLVAGQGGRIWVDERPGPGTIIHFTLPLADAREK
jgi:PAS domain S-box-containing protein